MKVYLKNYRQSPRKVRLVADMIRGKAVPQALTLLRATPKRATGPIEKALKSAMANAKQHGVADVEALVISEIRVDKGITMQRYLPRAQGRATAYDKHSSNIILVLGEAQKKGKKGASASKAPIAKTVAKKVAKKAPAKKSAKESS